MFFAAFPYQSNLHLFLANLHSLIFIIFHWSETFCFIKNLNQVWYDPRARTFIVGISFLFNPVLGGARSERMELGDGLWQKRQKDKKTKRQKTKRQKGKKAERQKDKKLKDKKTKMLGGAWGSERIEFNRFPFSSPAASTAAPMPDLNLKNRRNQNCSFDNIFLPACNQPITLWPILGLLCLSPILVSFYLLWSSVRCLVNLSPL